MSERRTHRLWLPVLLLMLTASALRAAEAPNQAKVDLPSVQRSAETLKAAVEQAVRGAGGDPERQQIHLVLALSTGYFSKDPLGAQAARIIASHLINHCLVQGDQLSVYAWEMDLWQHPQAPHNPTTVPADSGAEKEKLKDLLPLTPQSGSAGGHDTEQTITEITGKLSGSQDAVLVLISNTAASISAPGGRVIGANDSRYRAALHSWQRRPQVNQSGASVVLPFNVRPPQGGTLERSLDAVIVVPRRFAGTALAQGTRAQRAGGEGNRPGGEGNGTGDGQTGGGQTGDRPPRQGIPFVRVLLPLLLLLAVIAGLVWAALKMGKGVGYLLDVAGQRYDLSALRRGEEICHLAGPGFPGASTKTAIVAADQGAPPLRIARLYNERGAVRVESDRLKLQRVDGAMVTGSTLLKPGARHKLVFQGEYAADPALPPQRVSLEVNAQVVKAKR